MQAMNTEDRTVILELNEHDALRLLTLILKRTNQAHNPWRPYWKHLAQKIERCIELSRDNTFQAIQRETVLGPSEKSK